MVTVSTHYAISPAPKETTFDLGTSGAVMEPMTTGLLCKDALQGWRELASLLLL